MGQDIQRLTRLYVQDYENNINQHQQEIQQPNNNSFLETDDEDSQFEYDSEDEIQTLKNIDYKDGCKHYKRKCQLKCQDCLEFFTCRICHDQQKYDEELDPKKNHKLNRHKIEQIKCLHCNEIQNSSQNCNNCGIELAKYFCKHCNLYDNDDNKDIYHCQGCGICRIGKQNEFFHCDICECCLAIGLKNNHVCIQAKLKLNCPICQEDLQTSRRSVITMRCGHSIHCNCYQKFLKSNNIACPLCKKSVVDPILFEIEMDLQISEMEMPQKYKSYKMSILCNDCLSNSIVPFHILPGKCKSCRSYNTTRTQDILPEQNLINQAIIQQQ